MVESVRRRSREGKLETLGNGEGLGDRDVLVVISRPFQDSRARVAQHSRTWHRETTRIEPVIDVSLVRRQVAVTDAIGNSAGRIGIGGIGTGERGRKEVARLHIADPVQLPAAQNAVYDRRGVPHEVPSLS